MRLAVIACWVMLVAATARAHPVAQGSIDLTVTSAAVELHVRVSPEEVIVASTQPSARSKSIEEAYAQHGDYLLRHLRVFADDRELSGTATSYAAAQNGEPFARYDFHFPLTTAPATLRLEQNALNEFDYAPGNHWEASYLVSVRASPGGLLTTALLTSHAPLVVSLRTSASRWRLAADYVRHGIEHILTGYDHLLFIAALALAVTSLWELFKIIAAFTAAHTITLTLAVLNIARVPPQIVEPMIAASIVFVALQNLFWPQRSHGGPRLVVAFFFGLFHGLGFAGGLLAAMSGMAGVSVGLAIIAFSIGVEIGHQCVVLPLFALTKIAAANRAPARQWILRGGSAAISAAGMFYLVAAVTQAGVLRWNR